MKSSLFKLLNILAVSALLIMSPAYGSNVPSQIEFQDNQLTLNGHGTRIIFFMKVYEGSLYLESKNSNAEEIIQKDASMAIRIDVTSAMVTADAMKKALNEGLEKSTNNNTGPISNEISKLSKSFDSGVTSGDFYEFVYLPEIGTHVIKNSVVVELIPGIEFKKAFFGIFLSENPIQKNLKKAMLGG
jgi:hypothetical protein